MYIIKEIRVEGLSKLRVYIKTYGVEAFRLKYASKYNVKLSQVKFVYEERG